MFLSLLLCTLSCIVSVFRERDNAPLRTLVLCGSITTEVAEGCGLMVLLSGNGNKITVPKGVANSPTSRT